MSHKVLLVEDNHDDVDLAIYALRKSGVDIDLAVSSSGEEAEQYLNVTVDSTPDLLLLDIMLPGINGLELLQRLRSVDKTKYMPIALLTTSDDVQDITNGYALGANCYLRKPNELSAFTSLFCQIERSFASGSFDVTELPIIKSPKN